MPPRPVGRAFRRMINLGDGRVTRHAETFLLPREIALSISPLSPPAHSAVAFSGVVSLGSIGRRAGDIPNAKSLLRRGERESIKRGGEEVGGGF